MTANADIYDRHVDRAAMLRLYESKMLKGIDDLTNEHLARVNEIIVGGEKRRLKKLLDDEATLFAQEGFRATKKSFIELAKDQVSFAVQSIEATMGSIWRTQKPRIVAEEFVLDRPLFNEMTLDGIWRHLSDSDRRRIDQTVRRGMADGSTMEQIALEIRRGSNFNRSQSQAIATTAMTSVVAQADMAVLKANEKAVKGWQYIAVLDSKTTPTCAHRDGHIYRLDQTNMLPPAHYRCRSKVVPVMKSWEDLGKLENVAELRRRNLEGLTEKQKAYYDGLTPPRESYSEWLRRQPVLVQRKHLGSTGRVDLFNRGALTLDKFTDAQGRQIGIRELKAMSDSGYNIDGDTVKFAMAKQKLDELHIPAATPEDLHRMPDQLTEYYLLQAGDLDGQLSTVNYRGIQPHVKKATKRRVLEAPPRDDQMVFNPVTGRYEDTRLYNPSPEIHANVQRLIDEDEYLRPKDRELIARVDKNLEQRMSINERAVVMDNLRVIISRSRKTPQAWANFKAISNAQMKFDIMNFSDAMETGLRSGTDVLKKLRQSNYIDPVLGRTQLQSLHDDLRANILAKNRWEDTVAPKIAKEMAGVFNAHIAKTAPVVWARLNDRNMQQFYLRMANRLSMADSPDRDALAVQLGRDLYTTANLNGDRYKWYELGMKVLKAPNVNKFFELETFGVQKRRMKSRLSNNYFGPYYDTQAWNIRVTDPRIQEYAQLTRKVDLGMRVGVTVPENTMYIKPGYKTYFFKTKLGDYDTRIPITSTSSFSGFPVEFIDKDMADALNWASASKYKIDPEYYDFIQKLLYFEDDKGKAKYYNERNEYRHFIAARGDAYERFKAMEWLRGSGKAFSNHAFIDHRARIYDRGLIGPQSGETFRPFLNTEKEYNFSKDEFLDFQDQIGAFVGGLSDKLEGRFNSLTITGRQKIAEMHRKEMVKIGNHMLRGKPADIRAILESPLVAEIEGEDIGKFYRFALETAKIDNFLAGNYKDLDLLKGYKTALALEQDASSSGAQIIALTTRNKQLAEMSNVVPTNQKRRLYDEIAHSTFNDPRFKAINLKLGLTEKDLRKAAKAQNMVTFYGAGERTGILNVEGKLGKVLGKAQGTLVVKAADRDTALNEISAQAAKYERFDAATALELKALRKDVKDIFDKGLQPGDHIMEQLWFLQPDTRDLVEKMTRSYERVVTPDDFKRIANIMSDHLAVQVPILKVFTKFFGRLAEDYLRNAKPKQADFDWKRIAKITVLGSREKGYRIPKPLALAIGVKPGTTLTEEAFKRMGSWHPDGTLRDIIDGVADAKTRRTGAKYAKVEIAQLKTLFQVKLFHANKLPSRWTNVPWVNFDGKIIEQNFTQSFEERLSYKDEFGRWNNNVLQVPQRTTATWWEQIINASGKMNDIADVTQARTAYAVNGNHSNDGVIVKRFHLWGRANGVPTSTIHDAFFASATEMLRGRQALRGIYADTLDRNVIQMTLDEMKARGLPKHVYDKYLKEAIDVGLIPVVGKSRIGGELVTQDHILTRDQILAPVQPGFKTDKGWYGVG